MKKGGRLMPEFEWKIKSGCLETKITSTARFNPDNDKEFEKKRVDEIKRLKPKALGTLISITRDGYNEKHLIYTPKFLIRHGLAKESKPKKEG